MSDKALRMIVRDLIGNDSEDWGANVILIDRHVDDLTATIINVVRQEAARPSATVVTTEMVERGAEQLCLNHVSSGAIPWDELGEVLRDIYRHDVRSVLEAAQPVAGHEGDG